MTTYNTRNPLGSSAAKDLYDNAQNLDHRENDISNETWPDRLGVPRLTWFGIEKQNQRAIANYGYITMDSFQAGATLTLPNQVLRDTSTGEYYRWDGAFPKVVPAGSTPATTGGVATGAWVSVGDASLRANLGSSEAGLGASLIALLLGGTVQQAIDYVFPEQFGTTYDETMLQAAINYAVSVGKTLVCTGRKFIINSPITSSPALNANFAGTDIILGDDWPTETRVIGTEEKDVKTGIAFVIDGSTSDAAGTYSGAIHALRIINTLIDGHANPDDVADGVSFGGTDGAHGVALYNPLILGFRDGVRYDGPNSYLNHLYYHKIGRCWRRGIAVYANNNSNENYSCFGGFVYNINNESFDGVGIYIDPAASDTDISLFGTSVDYCDISSLLYQSSLNLHSCHWENNNNNPHIYLIYTGSKARPTINMYGGSLTTGPGGTNLWTGIPVEQSGGRDAVILVSNANGGTVNINVNDTKIMGYSTTNPRKTQLVKIVGGNVSLLGRINLKPLLDAGNTSTSSTPVSICNALNSINPGTTSLGSWSQTVTRDDGTITFSLDTSVYYDSDYPYSRKYVGTGGYSTGLYQEVPCASGQQINIKAAAKITDLTAGYQALRIDFYDAKGNVIDSSIKSNLAVTTEFQHLWVFMNVPNGAVKVRVQEYYNSFTGTGYFSLERVWIY